MAKDTRLSGFKTLALSSVWPLNSKPKTRLSTLGQPLVV